MPQRHHNYNILGMNLVKETERRQDIDVDIQNIAVSKCVNILKGIDKLIPSLNQLPHSTPQSPSPPKIKKQIRGHDKKIAIVGSLNLALILIPNNVVNATYWILCRWIGISVAMSWWISGKNGGQFFSSITIPAARRKISETTI